MRVWTRSDWGARPPKNTPTTMPTPVTMAVIHHTVTTWPDSPYDAASECRGIQAFHQDGRGWNDIGYSFLFGCGDCYEGRSWGIVQAAQQGYNATAQSFAILGDGRWTPAPLEDLQAVAATIRAGIAFGALTADCAIVAHRDLDAGTECCGDAIYAQLDTIRDLVHGSDPVTPTQQLVADMYRLWCLREGDPAGIDYWASLLDNGSIDKQWLAMRMLYDEGWQRMVDRTGGVG